MMEPNFICVGVAIVIVGLALIGGGLYFAFVAGGISDDFYKG